MITKRAITRSFAFSTLVRLEIVHQQNVMPKGRLKKPTNSEMHVAKHTTGCAIKNRHSATSVHCRKLAYARL